MPRPSSPPRPVIARTAFQGAFRSRDPARRGGTTRSAVLSPRSARFFFFFFPGRELNRGVGSALSASPSVPRLTDDPPRSPHARPNTDSYRVRRLSDDKVYALKETNVRNLSQQERQEAVNEIRLLASVQQNAAISGFHEAFIDGNRLCIVMEYAPFGDLSRALRKRQAQRKLLPEDLIWSYFIQIARGLQALHAQKILHRDVKTANVLRMSGEIVKLGDLGVAKLMKGAMTNTQIGTPHYMPPEVWRNRPYTFNSDVWALGCVLFEMCTFAVPFEARSMEELRFKVMKGKFPALPAVYSSDMQKMVRWLMIAEPSQRPDVDAVLDHPSVRRRAHLAPEPEPLVPEDNARVSEELRGAPRGAGGAADQPGSAVTLGTIKVPKNLKMLKKRLPAPSYPSDHEKAAKERAAAAERAEKEQRLAQARGRALSAAAAADKDNEQEKTAKELSKEPNVVELKAANASAAQAPAAPAARARNALAPPALARGAPSAAANAAPSRAVALREARMGKQSGDAKPAGFRHGIARPSAKVVVDVADVPPLHRPDNRENNLGNGYRQRLGGGVRENQVVNSGNSEPQERRNASADFPGGARERALAAAERARAERERASGIREMRAEMHRERAGAHPSHVAANGRQGGENEKKSASEYAAAPSRIKLPLISGNGAVVARRDPSLVPGYAPAAPLPGGRAAGLAGARPPPFGVPLAGAGAKADEENARTESENGKMGAAAMPGNEKRRVGLSNLSNLGDGAKRGAPRPAARRPAPMARNFYF